MLCILNLIVMLDHVMRVSICPYFEAANAINLALAQIVIKSTSLFFFCTEGRKERKTKPVG